MSKESIKITAFEAANETKQATQIGREIEMFRTHFNPMITPAPKQAFMPKDSKMKAYLGEIGIHVIMDSGIEHFVPYANVESIRLVRSGTI